MNLSPRPPDGFIKSVRSRLRLVWERRYRAHLVARAVVDDADTRCIDEWDHLSRLGRSSTWESVASVGSRVEQRIMAMLRLGRGGLNHQLYRFGVTDSPECPCGYHSETAAHFLLHCPRWSVQRASMLTAVTQACSLPLATEVTERLLLGGCSITFMQPIAHGRSVRAFLRDLEPHQHTAVVQAVCRFVFATKGKFWWSRFLGRRKRRGGGGRGSLGLIPRGRARRGGRG